ncbi:hypothetical protein ACLIJR_11000 [Hydrogenophaga sp. XSHU_21]
MHFFAVLLLPLVVQVLAYMGVFIAAQGGGSFMGLLAMPVAAVSVLALLVHGVLAVRQRSSLAGAMGLSLVIAILPPLLLLVFRALES